MKKKRTTYTGAIVVDEHGRLDEPAVFMRAPDDLLDRRVEAIVITAIDLQ